MPAPLISEKELNRPAIVGSYVSLWLSLLEQRGVPAARVLDGTGLRLRDLSGEDARVSVVQLGLVVARGFGLTGDPTLGYAFGLAMKPTAHGFLGYAAMTCATLGDAIALGERYLRLRVPRARWRLSVEGETAVLALEDEFVPGLFRQFSLEVVTAAITRAAQLMLGAEGLELELWVDYPEPSYYAEMRAQLPRVRFSMPMNAVRFPRAYLERDLALADPAASRGAVAQLERELRVLGETETSLSLRVGAMLSDADGEYPGLESVARRLGVSGRSLKRKLHAEGTSFQQLLNEARHARACELLREKGLSIESVATRLGYADPANFTRAFRKWEGKTPKAFRDEVPRGLSRRSSGRITGRG